MLLFDCFIFFEQEMIVFDKNYAHVTYDMIFISMKRFLFALKIKTLPFCISSKNDTHTLLIFKQYKLNDVVKEIKMEFYNLTSYFMYSLNIPFYFGLILQ